jgi:heme-degrading monooxygenase HmoA
MFARFLELTIKPEKKPELIKTMKNDVLPVLKKCNGFFDLIPLEVEAEPTKFYVMSLWHENRDAEAFHTEQFPKVKLMYEQFLTAPVIVKLCYVDETIPKKFVAAAAAA